MSKLAIIDQGDGLFIIDSDLTFATIDKESVKSFAFLQTAKEITIDFERVACTDSAGLALMIEWIKHCRQNSTELHFKNIPDQLRKIARLSGFDQSSHFVTTD
jgi:phospholipid transport system transporter-binding protein